MNDYTTLELNVDGQGIARLMLNRPTKHNSLNSQMIDELRAALDFLNANEDIRVVVLSGAGKSFCAGADLTWMHQQINNTKQERYQEALNLARMFEELNTLNKLVIARVNGSAFGGGLGLISVCDIAIAHDQAQFCLSETKLGLIPAIITPFVVTKIGVGHMRRLSLNASPFSAHHALRYGLLSHTAEWDKLDQSIHYEIECALKCAPGAIAQTKSWVHKVSRKSDIPSAELLAQQLAKWWDQAEAQDGVTAFLNKSSPAWNMTE
ncbi:MAG: enoyl-CoA hydratase-related protein [Magnetovibrio sp.]|nr:enoyl-CoA hydratase-related protein [Magnetovibrio sp.]